MTRTAREIESTMNRRSPQENHFQVENMNWVAGRKPKRTTRRYAAGTVALALTCSMLGWLTTDAAADVVARPGTPTAPTVLIVDSKVVEPQKDEDSIGPEAFAIDGDRIFLADQVNNSVRTYLGSDLVQVSNLGGIEPIDLKWTGGALMTLDGESTVYHLNVTGAVASNHSQPVSLGDKSETVEIPAGSLPSDPEATSLSYSISARQFDTSTNSTVVRYTDNVAVSGQDGGAVTSEYGNSAGAGLPLAARERILPLANGFRVTDWQWSTLRTIAMPNEPESLDLIAKTDTFIYYLGVDSAIRPDGTTVFNRYVFKFDRSSNVCVATYTLKSTETVPNRDLVVSNENVYQMVLSRTAATILRLNPDTSTPASPAPISQVTPDTSTSSVK